MFWRLLEWGFLVATAILGGRFIYLLWTGKPRHTAEKHLADAQEDAAIANLEHQAEALRQRGKPKEPSVWSRSKKR